MGDSGSGVVAAGPASIGVPALSRAQWLRYGPFLSQLVIVRRCNLACGYCSEFDKVSEPVEREVLEARLRHLRALRSWAVCLTGGEPTLHPDLPQLVRLLRELGVRRRMMISNALRFDVPLIEALNDAGLTDLQVSVDGTTPNAVTKKVLKILRPKLDLLREHARFRVVISGVIGSAPPEEALAVVEYAKQAGFSPRILLIHNDRGQLRLRPAELEAYREVKRRIGRAASEAHNYRERLIEDGEAPFKCRAGSRYLYVDEHGVVSWCSQRRDGFRKPLLDYTYDDLRAQFHAGKPCHATCTVGCARTASAYDEWRAQTGSPVRRP